MKETKFTPGPWRYCNEDKGGCICGQVWSKTADIEVATAFHKDEEIGEIPLEEMKANAFLIAAAPDMYEALNELLKWYKDATETVHRNYDLIDKVQLVLSKAVKQ